MREPSTNKHLIFRMVKKQEQLTSVDILIKKINTTHSISVGIIYSIAYASQLSENNRTSCCVLFLNLRDDGHPPIDCPCDVMDSAIIK